MSWYVRSWAPGDVHRGVFDQGSVHAACDLTFFPIRVGGQASYPRLPEAGQVCPGCMAQAANEVVIPAVCSRHPEEAISLVVSNLGQGRITLASHTPHGCVLTLPSALLFDALGGWLE